MEIAEVVERFDLAHVNRKSAQFDLDKCNWLNAQYLAQMPVTRYAELARPFLEKAGISVADEAQLLRVLPLVQEKVKFLTELPAWVSYFFTDEYEYEAEAAEKTLRKPGALDRLAQLGAAFRDLAAWDAAGLETRLKETAAAVPCKPAEFIHPSRVAVSGRSGRAEPLPHAGSARKGAGARKVRTHPRGFFRVAVQPAKADARRSGRKGAVGPPIFSCVPAFLIHP
jgi:glutamyl-tRNA synthetase